jgi:hypothetical protein
MFDFFRKKNFTPEERSVRLAQKLLEEINDCSNDIRIMWKGKDPTSLFPETTAALSEMGSFLSTHGGGPFSSWTSQSRSFGWGAQVSAYDKGAITSLIKTHSDQIVKILDKHEKECAQASAPQASFLIDFVPFIGAFKGSGMIDDRLTFLAELVDAINAQSPLMLDQTTRLEGAESDEVQTITYKYTVLDGKLASSNDLQGVQQKLKEIQLNIIKTNSETDLMRMIQFGMRVRYVYSSSDGRVLMDFFISGKEL